VTATGVTRAVYANVLGEPGHGLSVALATLTFGRIGIGMAVLIVGNVVNGAVVSGYRRIGVLKSLGFTPAQVVIAYVAQAGLPALAGIAAGVVAGRGWRG